MSAIANRQRILVFGALFGAWIGLIYAFISQAINWLVLPGISITPPPGGLFLYLAQYMGIGILLGFISAIPENRLAGMIYGGLVSTILLTAVTLARAWGQAILGSTILLLLCTFMPLIVLLAPIALLIRAGVDAQHVQPDKPHLWARKYIIPLVLTVVVVILGSLSMFSKDHQRAILAVDAMIQQGMQASSAEELPVPLLDVPGFIENGNGAYSLNWSDRIDTFFGPRPAGAELSQFLVIARFDNGFTFACIFSDNRITFNCAPH